MNQPLSIQAEAASTPDGRDQHIPDLSSGQILKGQYLRPWRSKKGKLKGLELFSGEQTYRLKLPKYLRPMLTWELQPECFLKVLAYPDDGIWRAMHLFPLPADEALALQTQWQNLPPRSAPEPAATAKTKADKARSVCIQVCRKGKCYKQGGQHIWQALQSAVEADAGLDHVTIKATGCMKACKKAPNVRVLPKGKLLSRVSSDEVLNILQDC
jgi:hypothetical protein